MTTQPKSPRTLRQRITFVVRALLIAIVALMVLIPIGIGCLFMVPLTVSGCGGETEPPFAYEDVSFPSSEFDRQPTPAYFIPAEQPTNARQSAATVIVLPTGGMGRGDRMDEIAVYHAGGFAVLTYTSRICVGGAANTLGYREAQQVGDALAYLGARADIDMDRIGVHGFSAGGAAAIMAAAQFPALKAVVAEGGYHDFAAEIDQSALPVSWLEPIFRFGTRLSYRIRTGLDLSVLSPISVIAQIAPRPILLIYGTNEPGLAGARLQRQQAGSNAALWEVPGARHGGYLAVAPDEYRQRVVTFMTQALGAQTR